jgi:uncharacterized protein YndB with AHSA1/START domain
MVQRAYSIIFSLLLVAQMVAAPLLLAQDATPDNSQPANVGGAWRITWQGRSGTQEGTMQLQQDGSKLSGKLDDASGSSAVTGNVAGNNVSFSVQIQGRPVTLAFIGTVSGDKMSGTFQPQGGGRGRRGGAQENRTWNGVRQQGN